MNPSSTGSVELLRMHLGHPATLPVAARAIADTAAGLGLGGSRRTQLEALMSEALTAVIADSFEGSERIDVDVRLLHEPGTVKVVLHQRGAPSTYVSGDLPLRLETLISLGYADSMQFASDGVRGSQLRVTCSIDTGTLTEDSQFISDSEAAETSHFDVADVEIRTITSEDVIGVARLYFRVYGYTKIGSPWIYEPDVFRHKLATGVHEAVVAVTPEGRIVGHCGILRSSPNSPTAAGGPLAVDPAYRQLRLSERMAAALGPRVAALNLRGVSSEAVTAHPASQRGVLKTGAREMGLILGRQPAGLDFLGFEGPKGFRRAVMVFFGPYGDSEPATAHVPGRYRQIAEQIYATAGLPRRVESDPGRPPEDLPAESRFATELTAATKFAQVTVEEYGTDFVPALQGLLQRFEREQFEVITVHLPLTSPLTAYFGAGLGELGLSFNAIFPEQDRGDEIVLGLCLTDQDPDTISVASEFGAHLRDYVLADRERVTSSRDQWERSRAHIARILDAL